MQKIRIKLKSYDHKLIDKSGETIVNRSPHVDKKSREQFELLTHKRLIDIFNSSQKTVDALMRLELPAGVDVEVKV